MQTDGPGLNYIRASYRKQAAQVAGGNSRMLKNRSPAEAQARPVFSLSTACERAQHCILRVGSLTLY